MAYGLYLNKAVYKIMKSTIQMQVKIISLSLAYMTSKGYLCNLITLSNQLF